MDRAALTDRIKARARELGFSLVGVCPAVTPTGLARFAEWVEAGYGGQMHYLEKRADAYSHPRHVLDGVRSIVVLAMPYRSTRPAAAAPGMGRVSRYAWGQIDYHDLIRGRLALLADLVHAEAPGAKTRGVVDTAPLLERELAQQAGLGWIGKNTLLLNREAGSWFFLAALLTDVELSHDTAMETDHCGTCRACLDACPTAAFPQPYVLDASRCISYLTIELKGPIPPALRSPLGPWLFGCDICQEVCPWNRHVEPTSEPAWQPTDGMDPVDLAALFELDEGAFRQRFRGTALWRAKRRGLLRNAAIALGVRPTEAGRRALERGLADPEPLVRGAAAWALGQYRDTAAQTALAAQRALESDAQVEAEIDAALVLQPVIDGP
jgi:epoxyqueuosine reductase